jgi:hypothetical protein
LRGDSSRPRTIPHQSRPVGVVMRKRAVRREFDIPLFPQFSSQNLADDIYGQRMVAEALPDYSSRSASNGDTRVARSAGMNMAASETAISPIETAPKIRGSVALTS